MDIVGCFLAVLTGGLAALVWGIAKGQPGNGADAQQEAAAKAGPMEAPRENAVLVFGSTGKLGRQIVAQVRSSQASIGSLYSFHPAIPDNLRVLCGLEHGHVGCRFCMLFTVPACGEFR